jgi:hypothetical protein
MKTPPTITASQELQEKILQLLQWSIEDYSTFIYEAGLSYLKAYFDKDEEVIRLISARKEFWNWFKFHWQTRDEVFVESFTIKIYPLHYKVYMYESLHHPITLAHEIYPNRQVLGENFPTIKTPLSC